MPGKGMGSDLEAQTKIFAGNRHQATGTCLNHGDVRLGAWQQTLVVETRRIQFGRVESRIFPPCALAACLAARANR
ncbi:hypothetical protein DK37_30265 [Halomonas sp. SUBG004]|nr:hypothetical protein DK37_30265 [Halomonas sp. SUBG004]